MPTFNDPQQQQQAGISPALRTAQEQGGAELELERRGNERERMKIIICFGLYILSAMTMTGAWAWIQIIRGMIRAWRDDANYEKGEETHKTISR
jgi:hypothetical protein